MTTAAPEAPPAGTQVAEHGASNEPDEDAGGQADGAVQQNAAQQQLSLLPQVDGKTRNRLRLSLAGSIELEVDDDRDASLVKLLKLGDKVNLEIVSVDGKRTGVVFEMGADSKADKVRRSNDGYIEAVVHSVAMRALSITHPTSEADKVKARGQ